MNRLHLTDFLSNNLPQKAKTKANSFSVAHSPLANKTPEFILDAIQCLFTRKELIGLKGIFGVFETFSEEVYCSVAKLSEYAGLKLRTTERLMKKLHDVWFVRKQCRFLEEWPYRDTNLYFINSFFTHPHIKNPLKKFFANMRKVFIENSLLVLSVTGSKEIGGVLILKESLSFQKDKDKDSVPTKLIDRVPIPREKQRFKKEFLMNKESMSIIEGNLDKLPLTTRGILRLSCYPPEVVCYLLTKRVNTQADDIFAYLLGTAKKYAASLGLPVVDFSRADHMAFALKVQSEPYIDAQRLEELKENQQREAIKPVRDAKGFAKQTAASLGKAAPEWSADEQRLWESEQKRLEMKDFCELVERLGVTDTRCVKERYDEFKALLNAYPVPENTVRGNQAKTPGEVSNLEKMGQRVKKIGINPEGLSFSQMNEALRGLCFCCVVKRSNGNNPACTKSNCLLREKTEPAAQPITVVAEVKETMLSDNFSRDYVQIATSTSQSAQIIDNCPTYDAGPDEGYYEGMNTNFFFGE